MVEILDFEALVDPAQASVLGRTHAGEEMQDATHFEKADLIFPSDEPLPRCWLDLHWREE